MPTLAVVFLLAVTVLVAAVVRGWGAITLMSNYSVDEYLATPRARQLYWISAVMPLIMVGAIVALASMTGIWWVTLPACLFAAFVICKTLWVLHMRFSGKYREFYRAMQWR